MSIRSSGGVPRFARYSISTTGGFYRFKVRSQYAQVSRVSGTLRIYSSKADFDADSAGGALPGAGEEVIELDATGPFYEGPAQSLGFWARGIGGAAVATFASYSDKG